MALDGAVGGAAGGAVGPGAGAPSSQPASPAASTNTSSVVLFVIIGTSFLARKCESTARTCNLRRNRLGLGHFASGIVWAEQSPLLMVSSRKTPVVTRAQPRDRILGSEVRMLTVLVVIASALVIMLLAAVLNRRRDTASSSARTSGADDGSVGALLVMSGDGASDCAGSDGGSGCDGGGGGQ